ncbi:hypothetical protein ACH5RR_013280 [Cinchona calisaya]|uniref:Uncharacterized protein n=1 Tax=Cinchona calisaya TaxID=153742 RepID=A0ABD3A027_9GENT
MPPGGNSRGMKDVAFLGRRAKPQPILEREAGSECNEVKSTLTFGALEYKFRKVIPVWYFLAGYRSTSRYPRKILERSSKNGHYIIGIQMRSERPSLGQRIRSHIEEPAMKGNHYYPTSNAKKKLLPLSA